MDGVVRDAKLEAEHRGDPATGPELPSKAVGFGPTVQEFGHTGPLFGGQPARRTGTMPMSEGLRSPLTGTGHPLADRPFADTQGFGDLALRPALLLEVPGLEPSGFFPIFGYAVHA